MSQYRVQELLAVRSRPNNALERLIRHNALRLTLTEQLQAVVSPSIAKHCRVGDLRGGRLTIHVAGAAWATRLRFELPKVRAALLALADFATVQDIRILALAGTSETPAPPRRPASAASFKRDGRPVSPCA